MLFLPGLAVLTRTQHWRGPDKPCVARHLTRCTLPRILTALQASHSSRPLSGAGTVEHRASWNLLCSPCFASEPEINIRPGKLGGFYGTCDTVALCLGNES